MVPPGHTLLDQRNLEAEATGLLDRMLGVLQDNSRYGALALMLRSGLTYLVLV